MAAKPSYEELEKDVVRFRLAEKALLESEKKLNIIANTALDSIFIKDVDQRYTFVNPAMARLFRCQESDLLGKRPEEAFNPEEALTVNEVDRRTLRGENVSEIRDLCINGNSYSFHTIQSPIHDSHGNIIGISGIVRDITERRRLEEELQRSQKLESVGILAGGIAHDFNNFLSAILLNIELAKVDSEPKGMAFESLEQAEKACQLARDLSQQLITFSTGGAPVKKPTSLFKLLQNGTKIPLSGSKVKSELDIPEDLWPAEVDVGQINRVLSNLCINAVHAMPEGGIVRIRADNTVLSAKHPLPLQAGKYIRIVIQDQGIGIKKEYLSKIFDPYFTTKQKGSGLGLSVVHSIVNKHGGYVFAESELGTGTRFQIYLPACEVEPREEIFIRKDHLRGQGRILVMDDEEVVRDTVVTSLTRLGYDVKFARDGEEAIDIYRRAFNSGKPFDAVILDLTVPGGMGGKEAVRRLLQIDPKTKAIVTSGYSSDPVMADCESYGFVGRIPKPYEMGSLSETVNKVVRMLR